MKQINKTIHDWVDDGNSTFKAKIFNGIILFLIFITVVGLVLSSLPHWEPIHQQWFLRVELLAITIFSLEYFLRVLSATENPEFKGQKYPRLSFIFSFYGIVDLVSILPYFLGFFFDTQVFKALRSLRFIRVLKVSRYLKATTIFRKVLYAKRTELWVVFVVLFLMLFFSSVVIYFVENTVQPEAFSSIPQAMWWAVSTMTTVGYGDVVPITTFGKVIGGCVSLMGVGTFAMPAGILASGFTDYRKQHQKQASNYCQTCGKQILTDN